MDVVITSMQPNPFTVHSGKSRPVMYEVTALGPVPRVRLQLVNLCPKGADITVNGVTGDSVSVPVGDLVAETNHFTVTLGLTLQESNADSGAIIGMTATMLDELGAVLSQDFEFLAVIGAA